MKPDEQKVALVTGSDGGIGVAIVEALAGRGYLVAASRYAGGDWPCDVSDSKQCQALVAGVLASHGRLDVLINNAAVMELEPVHSHSPDRWWEILQVNLSGPFFLARAAAGALRQSRGVIVNMSSRIAFTGGANASAYAASKAGLIGLTKSLALELAPEVRVNAVAPGAVDTAQLRVDAADLDIPFDEYRRKIASSTPLQRIASPGDVAATVAFLVSEDARHYSGQVLSPNGGALMAS